jgi:hypothetical protein
MKREKKIASMVARIYAEACPKNRELMNTIIEEFK